MKKLLQACALATALLCVTACDTTSPVAPYSSSTPNALAFQAALKPSGLNVSVGEFTTAPSVKTPMCRLVGVLDVTTGKPINEYIKNALQTELFAAQVYDASSKIIINGSIEELRVNTVGDANWTIVLNIKSNFDPVGYRIKSVYKFATSFSGNSACQNATNAFGAAVQEAVGEIVADPGFSKLVGKTAK